MWQHLKCFWLGHNWRFLSFEESEPWGKMMKSCKRCGAFR